MHFLSAARLLLWHFAQFQFEFHFSPAATEMHVNFNQLLHTLCSLSLFSSGSCQFAKVQRWNFMGIAYFGSKWFYIRDTVEMSQKYDICSHIH